VFAGFACYEPVQAFTSVHGIITEDTTWTVANSPYTLIGAVRITSDVTLTIDPGVTVNLDDTCIQVEGTLIARGTTRNPIQFNEGGSSSSSTDSGLIFTASSSNWDESTQTGCIIENAVLNHANIEITGASPKISNNTFNSRISTTGGAPQICNNIFKGGNGIVLYDSNEVIRGNIFSGTSQAIYVGGADCAPLIERNLIVDNGYGIVIPSSSGAFSPLIQNNTLANNTDALCIAGGGTPTPTIRYNNIYGSSGYNVRLTDIQTNMNATYNWWGITNAQNISEKILDYTYDPTLGNLTFTPYLNKPNPQAMPDINLPTEFPSSTPMETSQPTATPPIDAESFNIESNSTVTAFAFNSSVPEISFTVNGTSGTTGYVKATIPKSFMPNATNIKVYLDGNQTNYTLDSNDSNWTITFTYLHSTHQVAITAETVTQENLAVPDWAWQIAIISVFIGFIAGLTVLAWVAKPPTKKPSKKSQK
jgi:hypothetical protein